MDTQIDRRFKDAWHFFADNAVSLILGTLVVCVGSVLVVPAPWLALNLLGEISRAHEAGQKVRWQATYERTATFLPAWGLALTVGLGVSIGLSLLVVPGICLAIAWFHAPVLVARGASVRTALGESFRRLHRMDDWVATLLNGLVLVACGLACGITAVLTAVVVPVALSYLALCTASSAAADPTVTIMPDGATA